MTDVDNINWRKVKKGHYKADGPETGECYTVLRKYRRRRGSVWYIKTGWGNDKARLTGRRGYSRNYDTMREAREAIEAIEAEKAGAALCRERGIMLETKGVRSGGSTVVGGIMGGAHWDRHWRVLDAGGDPLTPWLNAAEEDDIWASLASEADVPVSGDELEALKKVVTDEYYEEHKDPDRKHHHHHHHPRIPWSGSGGMGVSQDTLRTYRLE